MLLCYAEDVAERLETNRNKKLTEGRKIEEGKGS